MRSTGFRRYLTTNSAQADFTTATPVLTNGLRDDFTPDSNARPVLKPSTNWIVQRLDDQRGARFVFFGVGSAGNTISYRHWRIGGAYAAGAQLPDPNVKGALADLKGLEVGCVGYGTITLSATAGDGVAVLAGEQVADTLTFTQAASGTSPKGPFTANQNAYTLGSPQFYSPADGSPAMLIVPDYGDGALGWIMEFAVVNAINANVLWEATGKR